LFNHVLGRRSLLPEKAVNLEGEWADSGSRPSTEKTTSRRLGASAFLAPTVRGAGGQMLQRGREGAGKCLGARSS